MSTASSAESLAQSTAAELAARIVAGEVSSREVLEAFIQRGAEIHPQINALVQPRFEQARADADQADRLRQQGRLLGPLHGVPVSIKDCFAVRGMETTLGIPGYSQGPAEADAPLVARLKDAGAVVMGKTNVPQAMLMYECANPVFGCTNLPGDSERTPGGSTGGEAALVAAGGSPIGLASDLGGSIRQPAAACGVFGFKPSSGTLPIEGSERAISRGMQAIPIQPGPMTRSMGDLLLALRVLNDQQGEWPSIDAVDVSSLRIATWTDDGFFRPAVGIARAVNSAAETLRELGAEVLEVEPPGIEEMFRIYLGLVSADGMESIRRHVRGGPIDPFLRRQILMARAPRWLRSALQPLMRVIGQPELAELLAWSGARSAGQYWELTVEADAYRGRFWNELADRVGGRVDAVVSPAFGLPALRHGTALHLLRAASHTFLANVLGAPAGVVPVGSVSEQDEASELAARGSNKWNLTKRFSIENAHRSAGLPTAVEVMAPAGEDEVALAVMAALAARREA